MSPIDGLRRAAPWLFAPELGVAVVGTAALAEACRRAGLDAPVPGDLDLAWALDVGAGTALLAAHGVLAPITDLARERGTVAARIDGQRIEITTFRGPPDGDATARLRADLERREATFAALGWRLADDTIVDPTGGLEDWRARRMTPCGAARDRAVEHPIRVLRWYRRALRHGLEVDRSIRKLAVDPRWFDAVPAEAIAQEIRAALLELDSPGRFFVDLYEVGVLGWLLPELAPQFDGRPAGPQRYHPEIGQALHLVLALEWAAERSRDLPEPERVAILVAVLCHDLGKNLGDPDEWPSHHGHEAAGVPLLQSLLARLPGLTDATTRRFAELVCRLHLDVRRLDAMRPATLAKLYDQHLRAADFPLDAFALAVGADVGGRLGLAAEGDRVRAEVCRDLATIRDACAAVDGRALRAAHPELDAFRTALHRARAAAIRAARGGA